MGAALSGLRRRAPYYAYRAGALVARALPGPVAVASAGAVGMVFARTMWGRRATVVRHLRRVHGPELAGAALDREVQRAFDSYARYWVEAFRLPFTSVDGIDASMTVEGIEHLDEALAAGCGAVMAMPHLGGWDFGAAWLVLQGYKVTTVVEPLEPPELFEWFVSWRRRLGLGIVPLGTDAAGALLRVLRAGEIAGLICDRDIGGRGVEVELFGERTRLPAGPATLALRAGAPILPTAVYFTGRTGHHGVIRPPLSVGRTGRRRDDVDTITQALAHEFEALVRRAPEQWHLFQPNWPSDPGYGR